MMPFDRAGFPFVGGAWLIAPVTALYVGWAFALPFVALGAFFAFSFRDPECESPGEAHVVVSTVGEMVRGGEIIIAVLD
jgi:hypothetical protein